MRGFITIALIQKYVVKTASAAGRFASVSASHYTAFCNFLPAHVVLKRWGK